MKKHREQKVYQRVFHFQKRKVIPEQKTVRLMTEIKEAMNLPKLPIRIECFDNSNISGTDAVAACVVFEKCKPNKQQYRKYNIKTVVGPDDYASMQEVVRRRYTRIINEAGTLPDLIITDGGKGQMECVRKVVEDELGLSIPIAGLAKDNRHRTNELLYGFPPIVIGMKQDTISSIGTFLLSKKSIMYFLDKVDFSIISTPSQFFPNLNILSIFVLMLHHL